MGEFVELCYGILFAPKRTFAGLREQPQLQSALLIVVMVNALQAMLNGVIGSATKLVNGGQLGTRVSADLESLVRLFNAPGFVFIMAVAGVILALCWLFIKSALFNLLAELLGGRGNALGVLTVLGAAQFPMILVIPVYLLGYLLDLSPAVGSGATFLLWIYTALALPAQGISEVHGFSLSKSVAIVLSPIILLFAAIILFFFLLVGGAVALQSVL